MTRCTRHWFPGTTLLDPGRFFADLRQGHISRCVKVDGVISPYNKVDITLPYILRFNLLLVRWAMFSKYCKDIFRTLLATYTVLGEQQDKIYTSE